MGESTRRNKCSKISRLYSCSMKIVEDLVWKVFVFVHCAQWATCNMLCAQLICFEMCTVHWREAGRLWEDGSEWVSQLVTRQGLKLPFTSTSATSNYNLAEFCVGCKSRCLTLVVINVVVGLVVKPSIYCTPESNKAQSRSTVHAAYNLPCAKWSLLHLKGNFFQALNTSTF